MGHDLHLIVRDVGTPVERSASTVVLCCNFNVLVERVSKVFRTLDAAQIFIFDLALLWLQGGTQSTFDEVFFAFWYRLVTGARGRFLRASFHVRAALVAVLKDELSFLDATAKNDSKTSPWFEFPEEGRGGDSGTLE